RRGAVRDALGERLRPTILARVVLSDMDCSFICVMSTQTRFVVIVVTPFTRLRLRRRDAVPLAIHACISGVLPCPARPPAGDRAALGAGESARTRRASRGLKLRWTPAGSSGSSAGWL